MIKKKSVLYLFLSLNAKTSETNFDCESYFTMGWMEKRETGLFFAIKIPFQCKLFIIEMQVSSRSYNTKLA